MAEHRSFDHLLLRTERLLMRPFATTDAPGLYAMLCDPVVCRYMAFPAWTSMDQAHERIARDIEAMAAGKYVRLAIVRSTDAAFIGDCCVFNFVDGSARADLGYCLARRAWGQGYMNEALRALVAAAFSELALRRLEADIDPRNAGSERSLLRLGFVKEGHLRERWVVAGEVSDTALYGLLRSDWAAGEGASASPA